MDGLGSNDRRRRWSYSSLEVLLAPRRGRRRRWGPELIAAYRRRIARPSSRELFLQRIDFLS